METDDKNRSTFEPGAKPRVIVASGSPQLLATIKKGLMDRFDVTIAASEKAASAALGEYGANAVVICSDAEGAALSEYAALGRQSAGMDIPVLFVAERDSAALEAAAFESGAADYSVMRDGGVGSLAARIFLRMRGAKKGSRPAAEERCPPTDCDTGFLLGKTILIAEDVPLNRTIIESMLSPIDGLELDFAENGREAVEKLMETPGKYAAVLMDVQMPVMDGLTATGVIRRIPEGWAKDIPIIALTADTGEREIDACIKAGMNGYLEKSADYDRLLLVLRKYCQESVFTVQNAVLPG